MSDMMFTLLCEATGTHPAWGMLTGVRPTPLAKGNPQHTNLVEVRKAVE